MISQTKIHPFESAKILIDSQYREILLELIESARQRIWLNLFSVNPRLLDDQNLAVRDVLRALGRA